MLIENESIIRSSVSCICQANIEDEDVKSMFELLCPKFSTIPASPHLELNCRLNAFAEYV